MTCLLTTRPLWQYVVAMLSFLLGTLGLVWGLGDQWRRRRELELRLFDWATRGGRIRARIFRRPTLWWAWRAHYVTALGITPLLLGCAVVTGMTVVNAFVYALLLHSGGAPILPGCR